MANDPFEDWKKGPERKRYEVSPDGRYVTYDNKVMRIEQFKQEYNALSYKSTGAKHMGPLDTGEAYRYHIAPKIKKISADANPEAAKSRAEKKPIKKTKTTKAQVTAAAKSGAIKAAPKPATKTGSTRIGNLARLARGGGLGGMFGKLPK